MRSLSDFYQYALISLMGICAVLFGVFIYRELFPEYRIYQKAYVALEEFRSDVTGNPLPPFKAEVKQIVLPDPKKGPETIDRCISCHVALDLPHFSPWKVKTDFNGHTLVDKSGHPILEENEDYLWKILDDKIRELTNIQTNTQLTEDKVKQRLATAEKLQEMKTTHVGEHHIDMTRVLQAHPLIGKETRPFEFHSIEEFGCTSCHDGNGRGLAMDRAHGPIFDNEYEASHHGPTPLFTENDKENDPKFSRVFNHKPGHRLLFHTEPLLVGSLMEAKCIQCHRAEGEKLNDALQSVRSASEGKEQEIEILSESIENDLYNLAHLYEAKQLLLTKGLKETHAYYRKLSNDYTLPAKTLQNYRKNLAFILPYHKTEDLNSLLNEINEQVSQIINDPSIQGRFEQIFKESVQSIENGKGLIAEYHSTDKGKGRLFEKWKEIQKAQLAIDRVNLATQPLESLASKHSIHQTLMADLGKSTQRYENGKLLFQTQACMGCHKIIGTARGGGGPDLTLIGNYYPWYIKESIVWPQADLATSTMPNFKLDHEEVEDLMTYLLAQKGKDKTRSEIDQKKWNRQWERGQKTAIEKPLPPEFLTNTREAMKIFATEGCASCHKLQGFDSEVGFAAEKDNYTYNEEQQNSKWFKRLFSEYISGSQLVTSIEANQDEIDHRIVHGIRSNAILEELEKEYPQTIESFYTPFKYAMRAKNTHFEKRINQLQTDKEKEFVKKQWDEWKDRVQRVLLIFVQEYGLGRGIGPYLHWSGIYRNTQWLVGHFRNPSSHVAKSLMPAFPYDNTKFYSLTYMLQELAKKNRDRIRKVWDKEGFNPKFAFETHCASCHGQFLHGNGPIAEWIYPIPKNLRNATFLRNLTKTQAIQSIQHGIKGTPMPPWGEIHDSNGKPVLTKHEIEQLVDWLFLALPGAEIIQEEEGVKKWQYSPEDVIKDLRREGGGLEEQVSPPLSQSVLEEADFFYAILGPPIPQKKRMGANDLFEVKIEQEEKHYFIKDKFYTAYNLLEGKRHFDFNCFHCHGSGDGSGPRSTSMREAKPRMLSNLRWISSRDDMRLLRSIKHGVPGTAMTPWGDKTNTMQRIQMVMHIRQLSAEKALREQVENLCFEGFEENILSIENFRSLQSIKTLSRQQEYQIKKDLKESLYLEQQDSISPEELSIAYKNELSTLKKYQESTETDQILKSLLRSIKKEKTLYEELGYTLATSSKGKILLHDYSELFSNFEGRFEIVKNQLVISHPNSKETKIEKVYLNTHNRLASIINRLQKKHDQAQGKLATADRYEQLEALKAELRSFSSIDNQLIATFENGKRLREKQDKLFARLKNNLKSSLS